VGRLAKQKRHDVLFEAFSQVDAKYKLVLLCNKPDRARKLAQKFGVQDRLVLPGFQTNPYNWIKNAEALVLSSDYEGLSMVLLEALAVGTKVVSTRCPHGPSEILTGEMSKLLVPIQNPKALASAINEVLKADFDCENAEILEKVEAEGIANQYLGLINILNQEIEVLNNQ
jgi:glycosyltransferase involved in cell wall biosynthesis